MASREGLDPELDESLNLGNASEEIISMKSEKLTSDEVSCSQRVVTNSLSVNSSNVKHNLSNTAHSNEAARSLNMISQEDVTLDEATMQRLSSWLRSYEPKDKLDEDELVDQMVKMNEASSRRRARKRRTVNDPLGLVCLSSDEDDVDEDYLNCSSSDHKNVIIEPSFFEEIIKGVNLPGLKNESEDEVIVDKESVSTLMNPDEPKHCGSRKRPDSSLCQKTIEDLRKALGLVMKTEEKKKKRRGRPPSLKSSTEGNHNISSEFTQKQNIFNTKNPLENPDQSSQKDSSVLSSRRLTRRMARHTRIKLREERDDRKKQGIGILITAMFELEENKKLKKYEKGFTANSKDMEKTVLPSTQNQKKTNADKKQTRKRNAPIIKRRSRHTLNNIRNKSTDLNHIQGTEGSAKTATVTSRINGSKFDEQGTWKPPKISHHPIRMKTNHNYIVAILNNIGKEKAVNTNSNDKDENQAFKYVKVTRVIVNGRKFKVVKKKPIDNNQNTTPDSKKQSPKVSRKRKRFSAHKLDKDDDCTPAGELFHESSLTSTNVTTESTTDGRSDNCIVSDTTNCNRRDNKNSHTNFYQQSSHPSLGLLDWRRRQQWQMNNETEKDNETDPLNDENLNQLFRIPKDFLKLDIEIGLPNWETAINTQKLSSKFDPPKQRHSSKVYASWCSKLINCLQGSGRNMARYEFFYSDIDRPWFNVNPFRADLSKLGVPWHTKLTRSEWSFIRRHIKKRPRRFSPRFIDIQMKKLQKYREQIRQIQVDPDSVNDSGFPFEVPALIRVGTTVTAFHKKSKILHRGTVLLRNSRSNHYLIQFERKELGCEYCPDIEVACHGVPEIIKPSVNLSLDGANIGIIRDHYTKPGVLPYGTTYGLITENHCTNVTAFSSDEKDQNTSELHKNEEFLSSKVEDPDHKLPKIKIENRNFQPQISNSNLDNVTGVTARNAKALEREILVKLMGTLDAITCRKSSILNVLENLQSILFEFMNASNMSADQVLNNPSNEPFRRYYSWVMANFKLNEECLESATVFLRVMYMNIYSGRLQTPSRNKENVPQRMTEPHIFERFPIPLDVNLPDSWVESLREGSREVSKHLCSKILKKSSIFKNNNQESNLIQRHTQRKVEVATNLLLTCEMIESCFDHKFYNEVPMHASECSIESGAIYSILNSCVQRMRPSKLKHGEFHNSPVIQAEANLDNSFEVLVNSVARLSAEYAASLAKNAG